MSHDAPFKMSLDSGNLDILIVYIQTIEDRVPVSSRKQVFETVERTNGDLTKRNEMTRPEKVRPRKIEDYEPGQSSIALLEQSAVILNLLYTFIIILLGAC